MRSGDQGLVLGTAVNKIVGTKETALITGASNGIGHALAQVFACKGIDLVLVARSGQRLQELKQDLEARYGCSVHVFPFDLADLDAAKRLHETLHQQKIDVSILVNNAGVGSFGRFHLSSWEKEEQILDINIKATVYLTRLFLPDMIARKHGRILNVGSTTSFLPNPSMPVYGASKAFLLSFSESLSYQLRGSGISVTTLCPGATRTGFESAAGMHGANLFKSDNLPSALDVAVYGYHAMMNGKQVVIHRTSNSVLVKLSNLLPRFISLKLAESFVGKI